MFCRDEMKCAPTSRSVGHPRPAGGWFKSWIALSAALFLGATGATAAEAARGKEDFSELVKLAPFVVNAESSAISVYARTRSDRRYGENFSERVIKVVFEAVTESTGRGLVVVGAKGEPHPFFVFRKFVTLAKEGKLDPEVAALAQEVSAMLDAWQKAEARVEKAKDGEGGSLNLDFNQILTALPMPLAKTGAKLYQLAWEEKFDDARVEAKLRALRPGDLERRDLFAEYEWVFYLPPKGVAEHVLDDLIAEVLRKEKMGFVKRAVVKSALLVVKPKIRRAIEGMRQGFLFTTVVRTRASYTTAEAWSLAEAYVSVFVPSEKKSESSGNDHERAVKAVRERLRQIKEKAQPATEAASVEEAKAEAP